MSPVPKFFFLALLLFLLSSLPLSVSESDEQFDLGSKVDPGSIPITSCIIGDFLVNDDTGSLEQSHPTIAVDSFGNFTISWQDDRNGNLDIYLQRYDLSGVPLGPNIKVNDDTGSRWQEFPAVSANGGGDLVLTWNDTREAGWDIYAQRYNSSGIPLDSNFKVNRTGFSWRWFPAIALDESGNFVIVWNDDRNGNYNDDIYAQRYDSQGIPSGANFKVNDDTGFVYQLYSSVTPDGSGGFIITWTDLRNGDPDVYAQRYNSIGSPLGPNFRVNDDEGIEYQGMSAISSDASGNFIITWEDERNGNVDIYAQRYTSTGALIGSNFQVNDDTGKSGQGNPAIAIDASGNAVITWNDSRNGNYDVYAQRFNSSGSKMGTNFLVNNSQSPVYGQILPTVAATSSNIYFAWEDDRRGKGWDIYAKVVDWSWGTPHIVLNPGTLNFIATQNGVSPPTQSFTISNDNGGAFIWTLSHKAAWLNVSPDSGSGDYSIITVNVNRTDSLPFASYDTIVVSSPDADNSPQMIPVNYYLSPPPSGPDPGVPDTVSVERMANVPSNTHLAPLHVYLTNDEPLAAYMIPLAFPDSIYDYDIICDSISFADTRTGPQAVGLYPVIDNNRNILLIPVILFASQLNPGNGPVAKIYFSTGPNWKAEYSVPINSIVWPGGLGVPQGIGLQCVDSNGQAWTPVFNTGALQVKESEPGTIPSHFELSQNYPNPFNPATRMQFRVGGLEFGDPLNTTLKIYNILGQLVRTLVDEEKAPGKYEVIWDGKDDSGKEVSSGLYFYQLKTRDYIATKKMVLLR